MEPSPFGKLLRQYRLNAGLSQETLAEAAGISLQAIGALERGDRRTPHRDTLMQLSKALSLTPEQHETLAKAVVRERIPRPRRMSGHREPPRDSNLAAPLNTFVGRESETKEITAILREHRLVTLTGFGGIGKSRIALEIGGEFANGDCGVRLAELAPLRDPELVLNTVAGAFGLKDAAGRSLRETLVAALQKNPMLLILDNCEHVVEEVARVASGLLRDCPALRVLATSREPLRITGERIFRLPALVASEAIVLFAHRAQAVDSHFVVTEESAQVVGDICSRLDGIPLAIELAAARLNVMSLNSLATKIDERFEILTGGDRTAPARRQTMRATIDWSYESLTARDRGVFARLAVFAGGCTLETANAVCGENAAGNVFEQLSSLVDKSLLVAYDDGVTTRYRMLESFRQYARERLVEACELDETLSRHAQTYMKVAERLERSGQESSDRAWQAAARADLDNFRVALDWALVTQNCIEVGQRIVAALRATWYFYAAAEGVRWSRIALDAPNADTSSELRAKLETVYAALSVELGEFGTALDASLRAADAYLHLGDALGAARAKVEAATALVQLARTSEAEPLLRDALDASRLNGSKSLAGKALNILAWICGKSGDFETARASCAEALSIYETLGQRNSVIVTMVTQAELEFWAGNAAMAVQLAVETLGICQTEDSSAGIRATTNDNLAAYLVALGRFDEARTYAQEALEISDRFGFAAQKAWALQHLTATMALRSRAQGDELSRAALLLGFVDSRYAALGGALEPTDQQEHERIVAALRGKFPADEFVALTARGATMSEAAAIALTQGS